MFSIFNFGSEYIVEINSSSVTFQEPLVYHWVCTIGLYIPMVCYQTHDIKPSGG